jgi:hypothetical protein
MAAVVNSIACAEVLPQFENTLADWLAVPEYPAFQTLEADTNLGLRLLVSQGLEPIGYRLRPTVGLVSEDFDHGLNVA